MFDKGKKGSYGYTNAHKKAQLLRTLIYFMLPLALFLAGYVTTKTKNNYFTIFAMVGCLPACKEMVNLLMFRRRSSMPRELYEEIEAHAKNMETAYELVLTTYEKNYPLHSIAVWNNEVLGYTTQRSLDSKGVEEHISSVLKKNGLSAVHVHIFTDLKQFLDRMDALAEKEKEELPFQPDERYPDLTREQLIRELILALSL